MKTIIETGLSLTGTKKLGNVLLEEAAKANKEQLQKRVITNIADLLNHDARWISNCSQCGYDKIAGAPARGAR